MLYVPNIGYQNYFFKEKKTNKTDNNRLKVKIIRHKVTITCLNDNYTLHLKELYIIIYYEIRLFISQ